MSLLSKAASIQRMELLWICTMNLLLLTVVVVVIDSTMAIHQNQSDSTPQAQLMLYKGLIE